MKEVAIVSGKGGTGKTSIAAALGVLAGNNAVIADCDVDAANMHILYNPRDIEENDFLGGKVAVIDNDLCNSCGVCVSQCRFDAIDDIGQYKVDPIKCEGCSLCKYICQNNAIKMEANKAGRYYKSKSRFNSWFVSAELFAAQENSGKLVNVVKSEARQLASENNLSQIIIDGPPGISCPTISSLSGTSLAVVVTEATRSGYHDLIRIIELIKKLKIDALCVINKFDLNDAVISDITELCNKNDVAIISKIPFSDSFNKALQNGLTLLEGEDNLIKSEIEKIWKEINRRLN